MAYHHSDGPIQFVQGIVVRRPILPRPDLIGTGYSASPRFFIDQDYRSIADNDEIDLASGTVVRGEHLVAYDGPVVG
jgi:hypothetical protein